MYLKGPEHPVMHHLETSPFSKQRKDKNKQRFLFSLLIIEETIRNVPLTLDSLVFSHEVLLAYLNKSQANAIKLKWGRRGDQQMTMADGTGWLPERTEFCGVNVKLGSPTFFIAVTTDLILIGFKFRNDNR